MNGKLLKLSLMHSFNIIKICIPATRPWLHDKSMNAYNYIMHDVSEREGSIIIDYKVNCNHVKSNTPN